MDTRDVGGHRLSYSDRGKGTPLVVVHGVGTPGEVWADDLVEMASDCRVIAYDRRGYGQSEQSPRDWSAHTRDAAALIETLGAAPAVVAGYSGGSIVALELALERPELVAGVVLLDPAFNVKRCKTAGFLRAFGTAQLLRRVRGERRGAEHWMRYVGSYRTGGSAFDRASDDRREKLLANASGIFADFASGGGEHVDEARLARIEVPVTIVEAELSPAFLRRSCDRLRRLMPQAEIVTLEHSGHHIGVDARDDLLRILREAVGVGAAAD